MPHIVSQTATVLCCAVLHLMFQSAHKVPSIAFKPISPTTLIRRAPYVKMVATAAAAAAATSFATPAAISSFQAHLQRSKKVLALCGAGLSAASGLPTFRGAGGMWKSYQATDLATHEAFEEDPGLVWQFYAYRRHMALQARPNAGHVALAELARRMEGFVCLTQNVDGECYVLRILL